MVFSWMRKVFVSRKEFSANFDLEGLRAFLEKIAPLFTDGFGNQQIDEVIALASATPLDETSELELKVSYKGRPTRIHLAMFMDDIESPDVAIVGPPEVIEEIQARFDLYCEERGI